MKARRARILVALAAIAASLIPTLPASAAQPPTISVGSGTIVEGDYGSRTLKIPVSLSAPASSTVTVTYRVAPAADTTTTAGSADFKAATGTLQFAANASGVTPVLKQITITVYSDKTTEPDETFAVSLSNAIGATIVDPLGVGTILNDDPNANPYVRVDVGDLSIAEGDAGTAQAALIPITLSYGGFVASSVAYTITGISATPGSDYKSAASGVINFAAGDVEKTVSISVLPDAIRESDERVSITLSNPVGVYLGRRTGTLTIKDDPYRGRLTGPSVAIAGDSITFLAANTIEAGLASTYRTWAIGVPGATIASAQPNVSLEMSTHPAVISLNLGTNDVGAENPLWQRDFDAMLASVASAPCIEIVNINDTIANYFSTVNHGHAVVIGTAINAAIAAAAATHPNIHVIDWKSAADADIYGLTTDGIHPSAAGSIWLADHLRSAIAADCPAA